MYRSYILQQITFCLVTPKQAARRNKCKSCVKTGSDRTYASQRRCWALVLGTTVNVLVGHDINRGENEDSRSLPICTEIINPKSSSRSAKERKARGR